MLMKLLGHESMATSQRYVAGAAHETRTAATQNPLYGIIRQRLHTSHGRASLDAGTHRLPGLGLASAVNDSSA